MPPDKGYVSVRNMHAFADLVYALLLMQIYSAAKHLESIYFYHELMAEYEITLVLVGET